ncbi:ribonuclease H-like domain-containing protein [Favolaschia claudopus]|uniref:Ribonuclease H-like domain-containing protein n=1 Tax=Favolaschia claudopus TaxID=2862362 RepID=A0AAW0BPW5_9AGAR
MAAPSSETFVWFEERPVVIHVPQAPVFYGPHWPFTVARPITLAFDAATVNHHLAHVSEGMEIGLDVEFKIDPTNASSQQTCMVQVATPDVLLVADMTVIIGLPAELRRILESRKIVKLGVGLNSDASILYKDFGVDSFNLRDLGYMIRIAYPERFADECNNVSLQACVEHIFSLTLSKQLRKYDWRQGIPPPGASNRDAVIHYAAADAEATLMMNRPIQLAVRDKAIFLHRHLPSYWYTYHYVQDACVRILLDWNNEVVGWKWTICPWYAKGKFSGYWE